MTNHDWHKRTLIVPANLQALAQRVCVGLAGAAGDGMFTTGLSADGLAPATHFISAGCIGSDTECVFPCTHVTTTYTDPETPPVVTVTRDEPDYMMIKMMLETAEPPVVITDAEAKSLIDGIMVSTEEPFSAMNRLGLKLVQAIDPIA